MKKLSLIAAAAVMACMTSASAADYEVTPLAGWVWAEGNLLLMDEATVGGEIQFNNVSEWISPEIAVLVSPDATYKRHGGDVTISRFFINGVHDYDALGIAIPFMKAGVGYEVLSEHLHDNEDSVLVNTGMGFKFPMTDWLALKLEATYMLKYNDERWDSNLATLAGLTFSFGGSEEAAVAAAPLDTDADGVADTEDQCADTPAGTAVDAKGCPLDADGDGVADMNDNCADTPAGAAVDAHGCMPDADADGVADVDDQCAETPAGVEVDASGCPVDSDGDGIADVQDKCADTAEGISVDASGCPLDSDGDGVADYLDTCPKTLPGFKVDASGCPQVMTLQLAFESASSNIADASKPQVAAFAAFLKENPGYKVEITGYTDSSGSKALNERLSKARAESLKSLLADNGVDAKRLTAVGKGEMDPVADNATPEGRAKNRRIEVKLLQ